MLSELPIDVLKLDMRFIQKETEKNSSRNILSFIVSLAKWMNLLVVAEGVETREQLEILRNMDCNYVQGYYYAKPMPHEEFTKILLQSDLADPISADEKDWGVGTVSVHEATGDKAMLIIDDIKLNRSILAEYFRNVYTIVEADNGQVALDYIKDNYEKIAIIMLDLIMPIMDGFVLLERLKKDNTFSDIPVIVTSQAGETSEEHAFELGASDFIAKPYNIDVAIHRVQNVTARNAVQTLEREKHMLIKMRQLALEAKLDPMTGLFNRVEFENQVRAYLETTEKENVHTVFLMLDIDNFKAVNDTKGHASGDEAIKATANILRTYLREDDIVCRMGGDEFAVFIKGELTKKTLGERLASLCEKLRFDHGGMKLTCSVGASVSPENGTDYQQLYQNADVALLTAKRLGKNQYQIYGGSLEMPARVLYRSMDWLLDESSDAIFLSDTKTYELLYMNNVACAMANKDKQQCIGKPCYEVMWGNPEPCSHCVNIDKLSTNYCEHEVQPQGSDRSYIVKGKLIDWGGRKARIQYIQDNTKRAHLLREMEDISADRKMLLDLMPGGVFRYFARTGKFSFISENMLKMLGYTRREFDEKFDGSFHNMIWHEDRAKTLASIDAQIARSSYDICEYRIEKKDGTLCRVYDTGYFRKTARGGEYYVVIVEIRDKKM